jgi:hypothetical protein
MHPDIDEYLRLRNEIARLTIECSRVERKAVEAWYDSLKPDQQRVAVEFAARGSEHLIQYVLSYAFKLASEATQKKPQAQKGSAGSGRP